MVWKMLRDGARVRTAVSPIEELKLIIKRTLCQEDGGVRTAVSPIEELKPENAQLTFSFTPSQNSG